MLLLRRLHKSRLWTQQINAMRLLERVVEERLALPLASGF
jgi:hypothetical protein